MRYYVHLGRFGWKSKYSGNGIIEHTKNLCDAKVYLTIEEAAEDRPFYGLDMGGRGYVGTVITESAAIWRARIEDLRVDRFLLADPALARYPTA